MAAPTISTRAQDLNFHQASDPKKIPRFCTNTIFSRTSIY